MNNFTEVEFDYPAYLDIYQHMNFNSLNVNSIINDLCQHINKCNEEIHLLKKQLKQLTKKEETKINQSI